MKFRNVFEEEVFSATRKHVPNSIVEHNKIVVVNSPNHPALASFSGPPKKEVDVIVADISDITLLISCKEYTKSASPGDVQEWDSVVKAMNQYGGGRRYIGMVVCSAGFSEGCEPWASAANLMLMPPYRPEGDKLDRSKILAMLDRTLGALHKRIKISREGLFDAPNLYDFAFKLTDGFEELFRVKQESQRYEVGDFKWVSSFSELVDHIIDKKLICIEPTKGAVIITLDPPYWISIGADKVHHSPKMIAPSGERENIIFLKNLIASSRCDLAFLQKICKDKIISSACDWGDFFEFGLEGRYNLRISPNTIWIYSTENPPEAHAL
ncbi:PDDEXK family nuclease [Aliidongia dinghuensis]|uniref:hypothetical protein n=1 Tax=Aliidongia dinghuensis TaxID=1867774 RepID=UPI00166BC40F|nr:hypothetical protein [Aliidongia dinghuensis]